MVNPSAVIEFRENTADDPARRKPDITKVTTELGWAPKVCAVQAAAPCMP